MRPIGTPLAAVPAHPVISFEAAVVPGHLAWPLFPREEQPRPSEMSRHHSRFERDYRVG